MTMSWKRIGYLKIRDQATKQRQGEVFVRRSPDGIVQIDLHFGEHEQSFELAPDIAIALADLLMEATAPK